MAEMLQLEMGPRECPGARQLRSEEGQGALYLTVPATFKCYPFSFFSMLEYASYPEMVPKSKVKFGSRIWGLVSHIPLRGRNLEYVFSIRKRAPLFRNVPGRRCLAVVPRSTHDIHRWQASFVD